MATRSHVDRDAGKSPKHLCGERAKRLEVAFLIKQLACVPLLMGSR